MLTVFFVVCGFCSRIQVCICLLASFAVIVINNLRERTLMHMHKGACTHSHYTIANVHICTKYIAMQLSDWFRI